MNDLVYVCAPSLLQYAVAMGLQELQPDFYRKLGARYVAKRDGICSALEKAGVPGFIPEGAYYVLADVSRLPGSTSKEKAMYLLTKTGVASVPGEAFYRGAGGVNLTRFCFAKSDSELDEACRRIESLA